MIFPILKFTSKNNKNLNQKLFSPQYQKKLLPRDYFLIAEHLLAVQLVPILPSKSLSVSNEGLKAYHALFSRNTSFSPKEENEFCRFQLLTLSIRFHQLDIPELEENIILLKELFAKINWNLPFWTTSKLPSAVFVKYLDAILAKNDPDLLNNTILQLKSLMKFIPSDYHPQLQQLLLHSEMKFWNQKFLVNRLSYDHEFHSKVSNHVSGIEKVIHQLFSYSDSNIYHFNYFEVYDNTFFDDTMKFLFFVQRMILFLKEENIAIPSHPVTGEYKYDIFEGLHNQKIWSLKHIFGIFQYMYGSGYLPSVDTYNQLLKTISDTCEIDNRLSEKQASSTPITDNTIPIGIQRSIAIANKTETTIIEEKQGKNMGIIERKNQKKLAKFNKYANIYKDVFRKYVKSGLTVTDIHFTNAFKFFNIPKLQQSSFRYMLDVEELMLENGYNHCEETLFFVIKNCLETKNFHHAHQRLVDAKFSKLQFDYKFYEMVSSISCRYPESALYLLGEYRHIIKRDTEFYEQLYYYYLKSCQLLMDHISAIELLDEMVEMKAKVDSKTLDLIKELHKLGDHQFKSSLADYIQKLGNP